MLFRARRHSPGVSSPGSLGFMRSMSRGTTAGGPTGSPEGTTPPRDLRIDRLRGGLVILMVAGNFASGVEFVPAFLKHTPDIGLTVADLVAPCFVFAIGVNFGPSFARRSRSTATAAYRHFTLRYLSLLGIGAILTAGGTVVAGESTDWGVLQALGVAGLICLAFIRLGTAARFAVGLALLLAYQLLLNAFMLRAVLSSDQGGFLGSVSWGHCCSCRRRSLTSGAWGQPPTVWSALGSRQRESRHSYGRRSARAACH